MSSMLENNPDNVQYAICGALDVPGLRLSIRDGETLATKCHAAGRTRKKQKGTLMCVFDKNNPPNGCPHFPRPAIPAYTDHH